jgi:hypothetical protein
MNPVHFPESNINFGPPSDLAESQCRTVFGYRGTIEGGSCDGFPLAITAWRPSEQELAAINAGQPIFVSFVGGVPPHFMTTSFQQATQPA